MDQFHLGMMNKLLKLYLILMTFISFAIGILGITMTFLLQTPIKDICVSALGFFVSWAINDDLINSEPINEEEYEL